MTPVVPLIVAGAEGRMGRMIAGLLPGDSRFTLEAALEHAAHPRQGQLWPGPDAGVRLASTMEAAMEGAVMLCITTASAVPEMLKICLRHRLALTLGATGLDPAVESEIEAAGRLIPVLHTHNFSLGVAVLSHLVGEAARLLPAHYDIEVLELHHRHKADAPSGTARTLADAAAKGRGQRFADVAVFDRCTRAQPRAAGEIGMATLRLGGVVGEHQVLFASENERLTLSHHAENRDVLARGALLAAAWLHGRPPGLYRMADVLGLPGVT